MTEFFKKLFDIKYIMLFIVLCLLGCTSKKNVLYFQGNLNETNNQTDENLIFQKNDILSIQVLGLDDQSVKPFNIPFNGINQNVGSYTQGAPSPPGYIIDNNGNIDFPVIGLIKLSGLNRNNAIDTIKEKLRPFLSKSTVVIKLMNFKITVLGEVRNPGTFTIPNERVTLPEALGIAGDLQITGHRKNVMIIREVEGKKIEVKVDLTTKELFSSPVYYLKQNDIVYVEPNQAKINSSVINPANVSLVISIISLFVTMAVLFTR